MARLYAFTPLCDETSGLFVVVGIPAGIVYAEANRILTRNLLALGVAAVLALLAAWLFGHLFVIGRTRVLVNTARQLAAGELGARSGLAHEEGEFGQLALAFDGMATAIERREQALRESEAKYRSLVEEIPAITYIIALDEARTFLYVSPQTEAILGIPPSQFTANPEFWQQRLHPDDRARVLAELARGQATGETMRAEFRMQAQSGSFVWFRAQATLVRDLNGQPLFIQGIMLDITERKRAEEEIGEANRKLKVLVAESGERNRNSTLLNEMSELLQVCQSSREAYQAVGNFVPRFFPDGAGALYVFNFEHNLLEAVAVWGEGPPSESGFPPDDCWAMRLSRVHLMSDLQTEVGCRHVSSAIAGGYLCAPMMDGPGGGPGPTPFTDEFPGSGRPEGKGGHRPGGS